MIFLFSFSVKLAYLFQNFDLTLAYHYTFLNHADETTCFPLSTHLFIVFNLFILSMIFLFSFSVKLAYLFQNFDLTLAYHYTFLNHADETTCLPLSTHLFIVFNLFILNIIFLFSFSTNLAYHFQNFDLRLAYRCQF